MRGGVSPRLHLAGTGVSHSAKKCKRGLFNWALQTQFQTAKSKARGTRHELHICRTYQKLGDGLGILAMGKTAFMFKLQVTCGTSGLGRVGVRQSSQVLDPS